MYEKYVLDLFADRKEAWCLAFRHKTLLTENHPNRYAEASMRVLKDQVCQG